MKRNHDTSRAWIELDLKKLEHNVKSLTSALPEQCELMAVVKAAAYGHGAGETAVCLNRFGVRAFAVATIEEGIELRREGLLGEILILGYTDPARAEEIWWYDLTQTLLDEGYAEQLNRQGWRVKAHIKIDTGMHRLGFDYQEPEKLAAPFAMAHLQISGIYTHLCVSDSLAPQAVDFTKEQIRRFHTVLGQLRKRGIKVPKTHIQSSYGLLNYPELRCQYVRAGISLYGVPSALQDKTQLQLDLQPALALKARVILIRKVPKGESVGYGRAFVAQRDSILAIVPIGYADGYPRNLSCGTGSVLIQGRKVPIVGRICMDQLAIDVTNIQDVQVGQTVTLIGQDGQAEISAAMVADAAGTITNELLSRLGSRLSIVCRS